MATLPLLVLLVAVPAPEAEAFCEGDPVFCAGEGHVAISRQALGFLSPALLDRIIDKNTDQDGGAAAQQPELHFTNCLFAESSFYIQDQYRNVLDALTSGPLPDNATATMRWGQLLHPIQDFYSHSSWVDPVPIGLGFGTTHPKFLLDAGLVNWRSIKPFQPLFSGQFSNIVPVEGNYPDGSVRLPRDAAGRPTSVVPEVVPSDGSPELRGLMTAVSEPLHRRQQQCPPADGITDCLSQTTTCIRHGGNECKKNPVAPQLPVRPIWANCFNHDTDARPYHAVAFALAKAQTSHEWCRLLHLLRDRDGYGAASIPIALWVNPDGNMHPPGTKCAASTAATASVSVSFTGRWQGSSSRLVSSFVAYTDNFRASSRQSDEDDTTVGGSVQLCVDPNEPETIAATLWGYEKVPPLGDLGLLPGAPVRRGVTVLLRGPDYPTRQVTESSDDVQLAVRIVRDLIPAAKCS